MADLSAVLDNYFTVASETFADNLSASISAGAVTVPVNNNSEYTNGDCVVLTVDPGTVNEATFIGKKSGLNFIECIWTEGNVAVGHSNGATIIDYDSATHHSAQSKGIQQFANDDGTLKTQPVRDALGLGATATNGWEVLPYTLSVTTGYSLGQNSYAITVANQDLRTIITEGMKLRLQRGTTAPTQCTDLESSSTQYASRASASVTGTIASITDDITLEAWVKPESYVDGQIVSRLNAAATQGWGMQMRSTGQIRIYGRTTGGGTGRDYDSNVSLNLSKWQHLAATLDMSGAVSTIYINGISVAVTLNAGTGSSFQNGTADLCIGAFTGGVQPFDGKISDVRVWNVVRTQTQIRDNKDQQLVGSETNLIFYAKLNGDFNDSTTAANNLTGSGGAVATSVDNPFVDTQYAVVTDVQYSAPHTTLYVYTGNNHLIPNMTLSSPYYSVQDTPYGFPVGDYYWDLEWLWLARFQGAGTANTFQNLGQYVTIPRGIWEAGYEGHFITTHAGTTFLGHFGTLSTTNNSATDVRFIARSPVTNVSQTEQDSQLSRSAGLELSTETIYYLNVAASVSTSQVYIGDAGSVWEATKVVAKFGMV